LKNCAINLKNNNMKAFLIVLGLIVGIYLFLTPFRKHFNTIELQNETIIQKVDSLYQLTNELKSN
jgi:hypothetical protein